MEVAKGAAMLVATVEVATATTHAAVAATQAAVTEAAVAAALVMVRVEAGTQAAGTSRSLNDRRSRGGKNPSFIFVGASRIKPASPPPCFAISIIVVDPIKANKHERWQHGKVRPFHFTIFTLFTIYLRSIYNLINIIYIAPRREKFSPPPPPPPPSPLCLRNFHCGFDPLFLQWKLLLSLSLPIAIETNTDV